MARKRASKQPDSLQSDVTSAVTDALQDTKRKAEDILLTFDLSEAWQQDNHYILNHYRPISKSCKKSFASITRLHNETVNIVTHLLPAGLLALVLSFIVLDRAFHLSLLSQTWGHLTTGRFDSATRGDAIMIGAFLVGAFSMFTASSSFHTLSNHSPHVAKKMNQVDYVGIICMILGSFFPSVYYGHYCEPQLRRFWLFLLSAFGFLTFCFTIMDRFRTPRWRPYRAGMFIALGLSAVIPIIEAVWNRGLYRVKLEMSLGYCATQGALYIVGACLYAMRMPERYWPGKFDLFGSSHQIFHCCVVAAGVVHAIGVWKAFEHRHGTLQGLCPAP